MCIFCVLCLSVYESISRAPSIFVRPDESFFFSLSLPLPCPFLFFFFNRFFFRRHHAACLSANSAEEAMWEFICPTSTLAPCPPSPPVRSYTCHRLLFFFLLFLPLAIYDPLNEFSAFSIWCFIHQSTTRSQLQKCDSVTLTWFNN